MDIDKMIEIFKTLPEDVGLAYPENWDNSPATEEWRQNAVKSCKEVIKILKGTKVVGNLNIKGKSYNIIE